MDIFPLAPALGVAPPRIRIVDVGAMVEGRARYAALVERGDAEVVGFEPQADERARLEREGSGARRWLPDFLGRGGRRTFHRTRYPGCSSLYAPDPAVVDLFATIGTGAEDGNFHVLATQEVDTVRLDDVAGVGAADLLKLDTQGSELDVLAGATRLLAGTLVIEVEVEFVPLYRDQPLFGDVERFLRTQGFLLHKLVDVAGRGFAPMAPADNPYLPISQLLWADAVFVRDFTALERYRDEDLLRAAVILHDAYASPDLALRLLAERDRRRGEALAERYLAALQAAGGLPTLVLNVRDQP